MFTRAFLISLITAAAAIPVYAQTDTPKVDTRQERQQERIDQGVASGGASGVVGVAKKHLIIFLSTSAPAPMWLACSPTHRLMSLGWRSSFGRSKY